MADNTTYNQYAADSEITRQFQYGNGDYEVNVHIDHAWSDTGKSNEMYATDGTRKNVPTFVKPTGTAAVTTGTTNAAKWDLTDSTITEYTDGMSFIVRVPIAGNGTYGTVFQINSLGYHPVLYNVNSAISTRYGVNATVIVTYNSTQTGTAYINGTNTTFTGVWQIQDYDSNDPNYQERFIYYRKLVTNATLTQNQLVLDYDVNHIVPIQSTKKSTSSTKSSGFYTGEFNPFGQIIFYNTDSDKAVGSSMSDWAGMYTKYHLVDLRYTFNGITTTSTSIVAQGKDVYLVATPQSNGRAKLYYGTSGTDYKSCLTTTLPTSANGLIYIYLGIAYDYYRLGLEEIHPIYYYKSGVGVIEWTGIDAKTTQSAVSTGTSTSGATKVVVGITQNANGEISYAYGDMPTAPDYSTTYKAIQTAVDKGTYSATPTPYVNAIYQNAQGVISYTYNNLPDYSQTYAPYNATGYKTKQTAVSTGTSTSGATKVLVGITQTDNGNISYAYQNISDSDEKVKDTAGTGKSFLLGHTSQNTTTTATTNADVYMDNNKLYAYSLTASSTDNQSATKTFATNGTFYDEYPTVDLSAATSASGPDPFDSNYTFTDEQATIIESHFEFVLEVPSLGKYIAKRQGLNAGMLTFISGYITGCTLDNTLFFFINDGMYDNSGDALNQLMFYRIDQNKGYITKDLYYLHDTFVQPTTRTSRLYLTSVSVNPGSNGGVEHSYLNTGLYYENKTLYADGQALTSYAYIETNYQHKGSYITATDLSNQSYVTKSDLSAQSYITPSTLVGQSYTTYAYVFANYTSYAYTVANYKKLQTAVSSGTSETASNNYVSGITQNTNGEIAYAYREKGYRYNNSTQAFTTGTTAQATGSHSFASGQSNTVTGTNAAASGSSNTVSGFASGAFGGSNIVNRQYSFAAGLQNAVGGTSGEEAIALGQGNISYGLRSVALCESTYASGQASLSAGRHTYAIANLSTAMGNASHAAATAAFSNGEASLADGADSHAEGSHTHAHGVASHADGYHTRAYGRYSHAEGNGNCSQYMVTGGTVTSASGAQPIITLSYTTDLSNAFELEVWKDGNTTAWCDNYLYVESVSTTGSTYTITCSANDTTFIYTSASLVKVLVNAGKVTTAYGDGSHAEGLNTYAHGDYQHVEGKFNVIDTVGTYAFIIGNGTSDTARSNAFGVSWNGYAYTTGMVAMNSANRSSSKCFATDGSIQTISGGGGDLFEEVDYATLVQYVADEALTPGKQYLITDYSLIIESDNEPRSCQFNYVKSAEHKFGIIVTAVSTTKLNEDAKAYYTADYHGDTYFAQANLNAWELKYTINNDEDKYEWANNSDGRGVIYWMRDEYGNEAPYDFKNMLFNRSMVMNSGTGYPDFNESFMGYKTIGDYFSGIYEGDWTNYSDDEFNYWFYTFSTSCAYALSEDYGSDHVTIYDNSVYTANRAHVGTSYPVSQNIIKPYMICSNGQDGEYYLNNIVFFNYNDSDEVVGNYCGENCKSITFGGVHTDGEPCKYNKLISNVTDCIISQASYTTIKDSSKIVISYGSYNKIEEGCSGIYIDNSSSYNTFGTCTTNVNIGPNSIRCVFEGNNTCIYLGAGTGSTASSIKGCCENLTVLSGVCRVFFNPSAATSSAKCKNIILGKGIAGTTSTYKAITCTATAQTIETRYVPTNSKTITV